MSDDSIRSLLDKVSTLSLLEPHTTCRDVDIDKTCDISDFETQAYPLMITFLSQWNYLSRAQRELIIALINALLTRAKDLSDKDTAIFVESLKQFREKLHLASACIIGMNLRRNIRNTIEKLRLHLEDLEFQTALLQSKSDYDDEFHKSPCKILELVLQAYHLLPQQCLEAMEEEEEDDRKELSEYNHEGVFLLINSICSLPNCPPNVNIQLLPHGTNEVSINLPDFGASMSICDERKLAYSIMLFSEEKVWNVLGSGLHPADFEKDRKLICQALDRNFQRATLSPRRKEVTFGKFVDEVK